MINLCKDSKKWWLGLIPSVEIILKHNFKIQIEKDINTNSLLTDRGRRLTKIRYLNFVSVIS